MLGIQTSFLLSHPSTWSDSCEYADGLSIVQSLKVVNDGAERGVALASDYNRSFTKDEHQKQCLLRSMYEHRKEFPSCKKSKLFTDT